MTSAAPPLIHEAPAFSQKVWLTLAVVSFVGLLTAPLPTAWIGLAALAAILLGRGRALVRAGAGLPYWLSIAPYLVGALVGYAISIRPGAAEIRLFGILAGVAASTLVLLAATSPDAARRVAGVMLGITIVATPIVFLVVTPFLLPLDRMPSGLTGWTGVLEPIRQLILDQDDVLQRYRFRASGLGTLSAFGVGLTLGPLMTAQTRKTRVLASLVLLYFGVFLLLAGNRGAMLSAAVATVLLFAGRMRWLLAGGVAITVGVLHIMSGLALAGSGPGDHVPGLFSSPITDLGSIQRRLEFWDNLFFLLGDFRFTGVGLGVRAVQEIYETYFIPIDPRFSHSHNIFLQTYLEQGPLGFIGLVGLALIGLVSAWRTLARINHPDARSAILSASGALLVLFVAGLTEIVALTAIGMVMLFSALALLVAGGRLELETKTTQSSSVSSRTSLAKVIAVVGVGLICVVFTLPLFVRAQPLATPSSSEVRTSFVDRLLAAFNLNQGAIEVTKASIGVDRPRAERDQRLADAEQLLLYAMERDPTNPAAYRNLAAVHAVQSQRSAARRLLNDAQSLTALDDKRTTFQLGRLYRDNGDVSRAIDVWTRAGATRQLISWGATALRRSQWRTAIDVNAATIQVAPSERLPWHGLAVAVEQTDGPNVAATTIEQLAAQHPGVPWPYLEIGDLSKDHGDPAQAQEWYRRAALVAPEEPAVQDRLADIGQTVQAAQ
jgi:O-antigen ligase/Flp pilus assembly protein TadD